MKPVLCIILSVVTFIMNYDCDAQSPTIIERLTKSDSSRTVFHLPAQKRMDQMQWRDSIYRFPSFQNGTVTLATGFSPVGQVRMNYNLYYMQMDYISANGDTLQVKPSNELKLLTIGNHLFLHDMKVGYIEVIKQLPVALGARYIMEVQYIDYPPGGTYRKVGFSPFSDEDQRGAAISLDRYYLKECDYFLISQDNKAHKATSTSIFKLFREHKKAVRIYIDEHSVDFENREDLIRLLIFCNGLNDKRS